ncbi:hypothetical protein VT50_0207505 [Streptomyces antioxidans]|uniref:Uncharacterized protein n=1 Tax=Streptomyces antioxidans TaxID=1507734 RepID=A0A1V4D9S6_9ACTN|nr:hypothetical protein [Streptomyces antioxidans]OPF82373.1 hypothetical protein VT50_0207505 [Streptomyces antioxidans]
MTDRDRPFPRTASHTTARVRADTPPDDAVPVTRGAGTHPISVTNAGIRRCMTVARGTTVRGMSRGAWASRGHLRFMVPFPKYWGNGL